MRTAFPLRRRYASFRVRPERGSRKVPGGARSRARSSPATLTHAPGSPKPRGSARWRPAMNSPEVRAPRAARLARLVFGRRTSSRRRLPRPNAEPFPSKPPSARALVDGVRTRERAVAGRLGGAVRGAVNKRQNVTEVVPDVHERVRVRVRVRRRFFFRRRNRFGFSVSRRLLRARQTSPPRRPHASFDASNRCSSLRRLERRSVARLRSSLRSWRSSRDDDRRRTRRTRRRSSFRRRTTALLATRRTTVRFLAAETETFLGGAPAAGTVPRGESRWLTGTERGTASSTTGFLVCVSRLVGARSRARPARGSNAGRDASSRAVSRNAPRVFEAAAPELVPGRDDHAGLPRAEPPRGGASTLRSTRRPCRSYSITVRQESRLSFEPNEERCLGRAAAVRSAPRGAGSFYFSRDVVSPRAGGRFGRRAPRTVRTRVL